jgi:serine/threonine protein kinase
MKIDYISADGIHESEKTALEAMKMQFNQTPFSQKWHGFAGFMMIDKYVKDREIDLVLLTHDRLIMVELKNWSGAITAMQDHWLQNGNDRGRSAVKVMADKCKILSSKIKKHLVGHARNVWDEYRVVFCGTADWKQLPEDERRYILSLSEFLKISTPGGYQKQFGGTKSPNPCDYLPEFTRFIRGPEFKPTVFSYNNFQIDGSVIFSHPDGLYSEYRALKKDDVRHRALLRRWDFSKLAGVADTTDERAAICLRENKALGYVHAQNEDLDSVLLQPLSYPTRDDVTADFCELYKFPSKQSRLSEFINRYKEELSLQDRVGLVKILISHFADLHDIGVAHRDIGDHSIWLERPGKIGVSGLIAAHFPEVGTVGGLRDAIRAGSISLPEDTAGLGDGAASSPFRRDVFLLGVVAHYLLFLELPDKSDLGVYDWKPARPDPFSGAFDPWLARSTDLSPAERFAHAREMLNALNAIKSPSDVKTGLDFHAFEPFKTDVLPTKIYPIEESIKEERCHLYKSVIHGDSVGVKIWYGLRPDPKKMEDSLEILAFLDKIRLLRTIKSTLVPEIVDYGLSKAGLFVVQKWIDGVPLSQILNSDHTAHEAVELCKRLVAAVQQLHGFTVAHGDLSPDNILVTSEGGIVFLDVADLFFGTQHGYTPAYAPPEREIIPVEEQDSFAAAKMCRDLLDHAGEQLDLRDLRGEIESCLRRDFDTYRLDRIEDELRKILEPVVQRVPAFTVQSRRFDSSELLASDNGVYYVSLFEDRRLPGVLNLVITGVRKEVSLSIDRETKSFLGVKVRPLRHSDFVVAANRSSTLFESEITLTRSFSDDAASLVSALFEIPSIAESYVEVSGIKVAHPPELTVTSSPLSNLSLGDFWREIIRAEEASLPEVEIAGSSSWDLTHESRLRIPYTTTGEPLDFDPDDVIEVYQEFNGDLRKVGEIDTKQTTGLILVLEKASLRMRRGVGDKLKLRSVQDRASFQRRQSALFRIVEKTSVIPDLIEYFDPSKEPETLAMDSEPSDEALSRYDLIDDGKVVFSLNAQQRAAFKRLWAVGPVGLLQGPPGTGKTAFIASFIHYAYTRGARSILLASQSHEAVNNAAEKVLDLCHRTEMPLDVVRFGAEGMVSEALRPFHSHAILNQYRELFRSEHRERVGRLAPALGLPKDFVLEWFDIEFHLGRIAGDIERLTSKLMQLAPEKSDTGSLKSRLSQRTTLFANLCEGKFGLRFESDAKGAIQLLKDRSVDRHGIRSQDALRRLDQAIAMSYEWIERLGMLHGNFEEFLAKTRSLVCGTCVGLGRTQFGITRNSYDWVIVDEAARATPGELAVAIQSGRRVLLVGDHRQLRPFYSQPVIDHLSAATKCGDKRELTRSDFERAFESSYGKQVGTILQTQYRMAPSIGDLVSECFYSSPLLPGRGNPKDWFDLIPSQLKSIVTWVDTSTAGQKAHDHRLKNFSYSNRFEAEVILRLLHQLSAAEEFLRRLLDDSKEDEKPIGIITTYAEQKRLIQKRLAEEDWAVGFSNLVKIDTVDSYQGKENRIIILSLTRNNRLYEEGYLFSSERTNVSISRAMDRLVIVGAKRMWSDANQNSPLGRVVRFIEEKVDDNNYAFLDANQVIRKRSTV